MAGKVRRVELRVFRGKPGEPPRYDHFEVDVSADAYVLDAIEQVWREKDPSLVFRHACHHASCGSCGMRINGKEKLACITPVADYPEGRPITVEPLRNFPLVADLVVDVSALFARLEQSQMKIIRTHPEPVHRIPEGIAQLTRLENCIECGLCVSACPISGIDPSYLGPAALAAAERTVAEPRGADVATVLDFALGPEGVWRCHNAYECSEVCPQEVDPAAAIRRLRLLAVHNALRSWGRKR